MPDHQLRCGIVGVGAIGAVLAMGLARGGAAVSLLARGATAAALARDGLTWQDQRSAESETRHLPVSDRAEALGVQDVVIITTKAYGLATALQAARPMIGLDTILIGAQNGVPAWFLARESGAMTGRRLEMLDPDGTIAAAMPLERTLALVVSLAANRPDAVTVRSSGETLVLGEPFGPVTGRVRRLADILSAGGFATKTSDAMRTELWSKIMVNAAFNPLSFLAAANSGALLGTPALRAIVQAAMEEMRHVGLALGLDPGIDPAARIAQAETRLLPTSRTSMLQDADAGRRIELDALVGAPLEIAQALGMETPVLRMIHTIAEVRARETGLLARP